MQKIDEDEIRKIVRQEIQSIFTEMYNYMIDKLN